MRTGDAQQWKQVDQLLTRRSGWRFQAMSSPGAPPAWCFGPELQRDLSVTVEGGSIRVYVASADCDVILENVDELLAWLIDYWPEALPEQRESKVGKLKRGRLFDWE